MCERNCFCNCDGSCRQVFVADDTLPADFVVKPGAMVPPARVRKFYPDNVPDFTREACEQAKVRIT